METNGKDIRRTMFYISRKVNKKYAVVDTSDNVEELYFKPELERIYNKGVDIKGVNQKDII